MKINNKIAYAFLVSVLISIVSCVPPSNETNFGPASQDFKSALVQRIYLHQDQQNFDSLSYFIQSEDPQARFCATRAFGSFVTEEAIPLIRARLSDSIFEIRQEAAYVAGQLGNGILADTLLRTFQSDVSLEVDHDLNLNVLEAIGKIGTETHLSFLATAKEYKKSQTKLNLGKALAFYEFGSRGMFHPKAVENMVKMVTEQYPGDASLVAAHYLNRFKDNDLNDYKFQLLQAVKKEENVDIRMSLIGATARIGEKELINPLFDILQKEKDYRVKVNAIKQMGNFPYINVVEKMLELLTDKNEFVALAAADYLKNNGIPADATFYLQSMDKVKNKKVKLAIQGAVLKVIGGNYSTTRRRIEKSLINEFTESKLPYHKADIVRALSNNIYLIQQVKNLGFVDSSLIVRSAAVESLGQILSQELPKRTRGFRQTYSRTISQFLNEAIASKDPGMISAASYAIKATEVEFLSSIDQEAMKQAYANLKMPVEIEAIYTLADAINHLDPSQKAPKPKTENIHYFDPSIFNNLSDTTEASIVTDKGLIRISLLKNHAPSSVLNFIQLSEDQFFNSKAFHRVVPNFVIQTGDPRGDGYGNLDFTIRSELSPKRYLSEGYVGMASAGKHTEGTQWFITHSPTPHLSGRYTIFGKVISGMEVVHKIKVGDQIKSINLIK